MNKNENQDKYIKELSIIESKRIIDDYFNYPDNDDIESMVNQLVKEMAPKLEDDVKMDLYNMTHNEYELYKETIKNRNIKIDKLLNNEK